MADEKKQVHYCNTCRHQWSPSYEKPCNDCIHGKDRWQPRYTKEEIEEIRAEEEIAYRRDNGYEG